MTENKNMIFIASHEVFSQHLTGFGHPESPQRIVAIENALRNAQLMNDSNTLKPRNATIEELTLCHSDAYIKELNRQIENLPPQISQPFNISTYHFPPITGDFQISKNSLNAALYAAGAPLTAIEYILNATNKTERAFCIVRPPGHHAHAQTGSGFCLFNNVAIAAKYLSKRGLKTVIVDWDVHHGDGTQELVENDPNIFYFSTHKNTMTPFYPGPYWGHANQKGQYNNVLNCPIQDDKNARSNVLNAFQKLEQAMETFKPDFVFISCGFDAHEEDPLGGLGLKDEDYQTMTEICKRISNKYSKGRIISVLEGGYNLNAIARSAVAHVKAMNVVN